ncbi:MAG: U32 family peptidase [Verrucomicrobiae bacterium]|nr:U32 family peptidase [Verrucomicrobiae bacterium]
MSNHLTRIDSKTELIAPVHDLESLRAAAANGADAVYFGLPWFNARMRAGHFKLEDLPRVVGYLHERGMRAFVTLNTLVFTEELSRAEMLLEGMDQAGTDAVIVQDLGVLALARRMGVRMEIHASTQMTVTSPEAARWAARRGIAQVVLARELSLRELADFKGPGLPRLEVFIHGALCISYSGQCLASRMLGGSRSANRGDCAQPCRLPYGLKVDDRLLELGEKRFLLSPRDLAAADEIPELIRLGVTGFKIEGRLKTSAYVAAATRFYRRVMDAVLTGAGTADGKPPERAMRELEGVFSRGLGSGWLREDRRRDVVGGESGKNRGVPAGVVRQVGRDFVEVDEEACRRLRAGDGVAFVACGDPELDQGGRLYEVRGRRLFFGNGRIDFGRIKPGAQVWKTSDQGVEGELRKTFAKDPPPLRQPVAFRVTGREGEFLRVEAEAGAHRIEMQSIMPLAAAERQPLTSPRLREQFGRLGGSRWRLETLKNELDGKVILPVSELNRLRRDLVERLEKMWREDEAARKRPPLRPVLDRMMAEPCRTTGGPLPERSWGVLCRTLEQAQTALEMGWRTIYADPAGQKERVEAVAETRRHPGASIFLAVPRIQKPGETAVFEDIERAAPDGVLIRNLGGLEYFRGSALRKVADFSLNAANSLAVRWLLEEEGCEWVAMAQDLGPAEVSALQGALPPGCLELVAWFHPPLFHTEYCLFSAHLGGRCLHRECSRPCRHHRLSLTDRMRVEHPVRADVFGRNTIYHGQRRQSLAAAGDAAAKGVSRFRIELLDEDAALAREVLRNQKLDF